MDKAGRVDRYCGERSSDPDESVGDSRSDTGPVPFRASEVRGGVTP